MSDVSTQSWYVILEVTEDMQNLSDEICKNCTTDLGKAKAIYKWIDKKTANIWILWYAKNKERMDDGEMIILDPEEILDNHGFTICTGQSAICVVLLRAQGIDAKLATPLGNTGHMVTAIYIDDKIYKADFSFEESLVEVEETSFDTIYEDNVY